MLSIKRYSIKRKELIPWIKFIWRFEACNANVKNKLLPTDCIDVIFNLSNNMIYETATQTIIAPPVHINGLRRESSYIHQTGHINTLGISFYPYGLFPFVNKSLMGTQEQIVDLFKYDKSFATALNTAVSEADNSCKKIETILSSMLKTTEEHNRNAQLIDEYISSNDTVSVQNFCDQNDLNIKSFERMVLRYTGYTPKALYRIGRFQAAANQLVHDISSITDVVYDNAFSDQSHFTKEFKSFSGSAPQDFRVKKETVKENVKYTYS